MEDYLKFLKMFFDVQPYYYAISTNIPGNLTNTTAEIYGGY